MPLRALICGATGFLGRHLTRRLVQEGWEVFDLRFAAREGAAGPVAPGVSALVAEEATREGIGRALGEREIPYVFHLAAAGVSPSQRDVHQLLHGNILLAQELMLALAGRSINALVSLGSCAEYGPIVNGRLVSESDTTQPADLYGASKAAGTVWSLGLSNALNLPLTVLRLFNTYGPGEAAWRLMPSLIGNLCMGRPVDLSPGEQVRDFLFVEDVVAGVLAAAGSEVPRRQVFNLCSGEPVSVKHIALCTARALDQPASLLRFGALPYRSSDLMWLAGDGTAFRQVSGWQPRWSLEQGLRRMIETGGQS